MPPHSVYAETHLGDDSVMMNKMSADLNIGILSITVVMRGPVSIEVVLLTSIFKGGG